MRQEEEEKKRKREEEKDWSMAQERSHSKEKVRGADPPADEVLKYDRK